MKDIRVGGNIGKSVSRDTPLGHGSWRVEWRGADGKLSSDTWDAEPPDVGPVLQPSGVLIYIDNHGTVTDVIGAFALVRVEKLS